MGLVLSDRPTLDFVEYNKGFKRWYGIVSIIIICLIISTIVLYLVFLRKLNLFEGTIIVSLLEGLKNEIIGGSAIGLFYLFFLRGLFFLGIPIPFVNEILLGSIISAGKFSVWHVFAIFMGVFLSYTFNYSVGFRFSSFSKNFISPKNFYKSKTFLNRWGSLAILFANTSGLGCEALSFITGIFRYNKWKVFIFTIIGQCLRYGFIILALMGFLKLFFG